MEEIIRLSHLNLTNDKVPAKSRRGAKWGTGIGESVACRPDLSPGFLRQVGSGDLRINRRGDAVAKWTTLNEGPRGFEQDTKRPAGAPGNESRGET